MSTQQTTRLRRLAAALILTVWACAVFAAPGGNGNGKGNGPRTWPPGNAGNTPAIDRAPVFIKAPEIDATAGVQGIALMTGVLLLVAERRRRQRG